MSQHDRFVGFDKGWAKRQGLSREQVELHVDQLAGDGGPVVLVLAGAAHEPWEAGVVVVTASQVRFFQAGDIQDIVSGQGGQPATEVVTRADIVEVKGPTITDSVKVRTSDGQKISYWCRESGVAAMLATVLRQQSQDDAVPVFLSDRKLARAGRGYVVLTAPGYPFREGTSVQLSLDNDAAHLVESESRVAITIAFERVTGVETGGPGVTASGGGFAGGGFGVAGFVLGAAAAAVLNRVTTRYSVQTVLRISTLDGELNLVTDEITPDALDIELAPVRVGARAAARPNPVSEPGGDDVLDRLERLAKLREQGALSQQEFDIQKQRVLGENAP